jgi:hypothetical protein
MKQLPRFDRYLIYFGLSLPFLAGAFLFGLWLGNYVRVEVAWLLILGGIGGMVAMRLVGKWLG